MDITIDEAQVARSAARCKERDIIIPTFAQQKDPSLVPARVNEELKGIGLWDVHHRNLFRHKQARIEAGVDHGYPTVVIVGHDGQRRREFLKRLRQGLLMLARRRP